MAEINKNIKKETPNNGQIQKEELKKEVAECTLTLFVGLLFLVFSFFSYVMCVIYC